MCVGRGGLGVGVGINVTSSHFSIQSIGKTIRSQTLLNLPKLISRYLLYVFWTKPNLAEKDAHKPTDLVPLKAADYFCYRGWGKGNPFAPSHAFFILQGFLPVRIWRNLPLAPLSSTVDLLLCYSLAFTIGKENAQRMRRTWTSAVFSPWLAVGREDRGVTPRYRWLWAMWTLVLTSCPGTDWSWWATTAWWVKSTITNK